MLVNKLLMNSPDAAIVKIRLVCIIHSKKIKNIFCRVCPVVFYIVAQCV